MRAGFAESFFGGRCNSRNQVPRLVIQRGHCRQHPLVRNILELALVLFRSLLAHLAVGALHFLLVRVRHGLPRSQQRLKSFLYFFPRISSSPKPSSSWRPVRWTSSVKAAAVVSAASANSARVRSNASRTTSSTCVCVCPTKLRLE